VFGGTLRQPPGTAKTPSDLTERNPAKETRQMKALWRRATKLTFLPRTLLAVAVGLILAAPALAQGTSPWENAVNVLETAFTSTIARGLSLVAIVVAGLTFAFGEGGIETHSRRRFVRRRHGDSSRELPRLAFSRFLKLQASVEITRW
jgi:type IV secretory pathway VirB2 component (pilin)